MSAHFTEELVSEQKRNSMNTKHFSERASIVALDMIPRPLGNWQ